MKSKNTRRQSRLLALLLSMLLCLSMMPTMAFSEDGGVAQNPDTASVTDDSEEAAANAAAESTEDLTASENESNSEETADDSNQSDDENNSDTDGDSGQNEQTGQNDPDDSNNQNEQDQQGEGSEVTTETKETKEVTRTTHFVYNSQDGAKAAEDKVETITVQRTTTTNSDGTIEKGEWKKVTNKGLTSAVFTKFDVPEIDGATPDKNEIPKSLVTGDANDIELWVIYTKQPKEITLRIMGGINRAAPIVGVDYKLYQDDENAGWKEVTLIEELDHYFGAKVIYDPANGTKFKWVEVKKPTWLHSPLSETKEHVFTLKDDDVTGDTIAVAENGYEYHNKATDNTADSTIRNTSNTMMGDLSIDQQDALDYEWWSNSKTAQFYVLYGSTPDTKARDYTLKLTVKKEVVNGKDPDREYEFTIMPLFGYAIDAKTRFNIAVPGEMKTDDGRLADAKVVSVWLNQPDGDKIVDEEWLAIYLKYIFQLTVPAHSGEYWKEKTFESVFSQIEKMNVADSGLVFMRAEDADMSIETLERVIEIINQNTNYFFEWEGKHFLNSWKKLTEGLEDGGYTSFEEWIKKYEAEADEAYKKLKANEDLTEQDVYAAVAEMASAWVKTLQDAGFTRNDLRFLRVFSQDGLISYNETEKNHYELAAFTEEQRKEFIEAHKDILTDELMQYLIGNTFTLKDGESKTFTIPNKVALDELGGLLIMEKRSDDYVSSGSISTYFLVAPEDISYDAENDTWEVTQVITNTFEKTEETPDEVKPTVKIQKSVVDVTYVDEKENEIAPSETIEDEVGAAYETEQKEIEGYKLKEVRGETSGVITAEPKSVEYVYEVKGVYEEGGMDGITTADTTGVQPDNSNQSNNSVKSVNTGDDNQLELIAGIAVLALAGLVMIRRRRSQER